MNNKVFLRNKISDRVLKGHPWIYNNEIASVAKGTPDGATVDVINAQGNFIGRGYYNSQSQIQVRLLTRDLNEEINPTFFYNKIAECWAYRQRLGYVENCRLVFGEADGLPSLIIDKFNDYFVIQTMSLGMDLWKEAIVDALNQGADIVITGRTADPSLVAAPAIFHYNWSNDEHDKIAGALIAGHVIECGAQVSGGISTNWLDVPDVANIGYPFVEMEEDGSFVVTKPIGSGGCVNEQTVKEQLFYEIGDPGNYISPDARVSMLSLTVHDEGNDRVRVRDAKGSAATDSYKVSATYRDGYWAQGMLTIFGRDAVKKAKRCGEIVIEHVRRAGFELAQHNIECIGTGACGPGLFPTPDLQETVLRIAVHDPRKEAVERFSKELAPLVTSGTQGVTGFSAGRPRVSPVFGYWPCLINKSEVPYKIEITKI